MSLSYSDDDLTTDAIPSPPRDEVKEDKEEREEEAIKNSNTRPNVASSYSIPKSKGFKKAKKSGPTAFASVINITNGNGIHIGSNYNVYVNSKSEKKEKGEYRVTEAIKALFKSTQPVDRKDLIYISPHLNEEWRLTARMLDYSDGQISQFYEDHIRCGIKEVIYQLFLDWIQNEASAATVGRLSKVLWETNQQDVVTRWCEKFTSGSK